MLHYHGGPVTPTSAAIALWTRRHALVSFARPDQMALAADVCQSFILDNGAFTLWKAGGGQVDVAAFADWVREYERHPGYDFALIPDTIDGSAFDNDRMIARWFGERVERGVPVWHMHEPVERLDWLIRCAQSHVYPAVALGSSGEFAQVGSYAWWNRMSVAMDVATDKEGRPRCKLHGLRMLSPDVLSKVPLASADSCNVARNTGLDRRWTGSYAPVTPGQRALVLAERIEHVEAATRWERQSVHTQGELF